MQIRTPDLMFSYEGVHCEVVIVPDWAQLDAGVYANWDIRVLRYADRTSTQTSPHRSPRAAYITDHDLCVKAYDRFRLIKNDMAVSPHKASPSFCEHPYCLNFCLEQK